MAVYPGRTARGDVIGQMAGPLRRPTPAADEFLHELLDVVEGSERPLPARFVALELNATRSQSSTVTSVEGPFACSPWEPTETRMVVCLPK
jgi:hypothetical protein